MAALVGELEAPASRPAGLRRIDLRFLEEPEPPAEDFAILRLEGVTLKTGLAQDPDDLRRDRPAREPLARVDVVGFADRESSVLADGVESGSNRELDVRVLPI